MTEKEEYEKKLEILRKMQEGKTPQEKIDIMIREQQKLENQEIINKNFEDRSRKK